MNKSAIAFCGVVLLGSISLAGAKTLQCPDAADQVHAREITATSAPEVKIRTRLQEEPKAWNAFIRPLIAKAVKQAKMERAEAMQTGIESACREPQIYVGQLNPTATSTGCEHRVVVRPGDAAGTSWVQVVAICKYTWMCCEDAMAGVRLEGPITGSTTTTPTPPTEKPKR